MEPAQLAFQGIDIGEYRIHVLKRSYQSISVPYPS
jgi:hypothetical protein